MRYISLAIPFLCVALATAQESKKQSRFVRVTFTDNSSLTGYLNHKELEFNTHAGLLKIKTIDLVNLRLGPRLSLEKEAELNDNLKLLSSKDSRDRELAQTKLIEMGPSIYPFISIKFADAEVNSRCKFITSKFKELYTNLREQEPDQISTTMLSAKGEFYHREVKIKHLFLGELKVNISHILSIHQLEKFNSSFDLLGAQVDWLDTKIDLYDHVKTRLVFSGVIDLWPQTPGQYLRTPVKDPNNAAGFTPTVYYRIDNGAELTLTNEILILQGKGRVYLKVIRNPWNGITQGSFKVKVSQE